MINFDRIVRNLRRSLCSVRLREGERHSVTVKVILESSFKHTLHLFLLQVSWIRTRDSHILTVDRYTFISDERFMAWHEAQTQTWTLQVRYVQERDAGKYECQVSTEPKMSHFVDLSVISECFCIEVTIDYLLTLEYSIFSVIFIV